MATKTLTVSCSCGAATHTFDVPLSSLPISSHLCNCDISRRISGSLLTSYINISHILNAPKPDVSSLTAYDSSEILRRWFCATCGTHMYLEYHSDGHFEAATGTLQIDQSDEIVKLESIMWIDDTRDGGASDFITHTDGKELPRYAREAEISEDVPLNSTSSLTPPSPLALSDPEKSIYAHCHCRGVEFWITPPSNPSSLDTETTKSPFPDLMVPHHSNSKEAHNPDDVPWWNPGGTHWRAGTCMCLSCRRASGFDITFWAFVPTANILLDAACTRKFPADGRYWGTMQMYISSPGVTRTFCSRCGANVFWNGDEATFGRRGLIDVAAGLLDAQSGAKAEEMLNWWPKRVSFVENAVHKSLAKGLEMGLNDWQNRKLKHWGNEIET